MASKQSKDWWIKQGYAKNHPVHSGRTYEIPPQVQEHLVEQEEADTGTLEIPISYVPTRTSNEARPRTLAAGYDLETHTMRIDFREGATYHYYDVPPNVWRDFKKSASPGKFMNRRMTQYPYGRIS